MQGESLWGWARPHKYFNRRHTTCCEKKMSSRMLLPNMHYPFWSMKQMKWKKVNTCSHKAYCKTACQICVKITSKDSALCKEVAHMVNNFHARLFQGISYIVPEEPMFPLSDRYLTAYNYNSRQHKCSKAWRNYITLLPPLWDNTRIDPHHELRNTVKQSKVLSPKRAAWLHHTSHR